MSRKTPKDPKEPDEPQIQPAMQLAVLLGWFMLVALYFSLLSEPDSTQTTVPYSTIKEMIRDGEVDFRQSGRTRDRSGHRVRQGRIRPRSIAR